MDIAMFHSGWTVLLVALFIGIVAWAFSGRRKRKFDEAARMPLEDDVQGRTNAAPDRMSRAADAPDLPGDKHHG